MKHALLVVGATGAVIAALGVGACGDEEEDSTTATDTSAAAGSLEIEMGDFYFDPQDATTEAGSVTITAPNVGEVEHELVLFKSDLDPAKLPTASNGEVDEDKLAEEAEEAGELEAEAGETAEGDFELTSGAYVMFCNLPGHYKQGMYGSLTAN